MFDELSAKLTSALQKLTGRGTLNEESVREGLREVRRVLLEAEGGAVSGAASGTGGESR